MRLVQAFQLHVTHNKTADCCAVFWHLGVKKHEKGGKASIARTSHNLCVVWHNPY